MNHRAMEECRIPALGKSFLITFVSLLSVAAMLLNGCSVLQKTAQKPPNTHYSASYISNDVLHVFPFEGKEVVMHLPTNPGEILYFGGGRVIYGIKSKLGELPDFVAVTIWPSDVRRLPGSSKFRYLAGIAFNTARNELLLSGAYDGNGSQQCGLFTLNLRTAKVEHIVDNLDKRCTDFLSSWSYLSISPDGQRAVATGKKGELGLINLNEHRIEKLWPGTIASWSPNGKWIAFLSFDSPMKIELISTREFSKSRILGTDNVGLLQWSPDSRYLLTWKSDFCSAGLSIAGTLYALDVETGISLPIHSSKCRVDVVRGGWVSDEVIPSSPF